MLLVVDPGAVKTPSTRTVRELFGFTAREAECAALLMEGRTLAEAAQIMGIQRSTARTFFRAWPRKPTVTARPNSSGVCCRSRAVPMPRELLYPCY